MGICDLISLGWNFFLLLYPSMYNSIWNSLVLPDPLPIATQLQGDNRVARGERVEGREFHW